MSPNPYALAIYLKLVHTFGNRLEKFDECQCEDDDFCCFLQTQVPGDGHYSWLKGSINPLPMEHRA
jgi:hypothetical protein